MMTPRDYTIISRAEKRVWGTDVPSITRARHFGYDQAVPRRVVAVGDSVPGRTTVRSGLTGACAFYLPRRHI